MAIATETVVLEGKTVVLPMTTKGDNMREIFKAAKAAALAADPGETGDGGTCNFDAPAFQIRMKKETLEKAAAEAGVGVSDFHWFGNRRWFWLTGISYGQGNRRTKMAEAACKILEAAGVKATMYYQMD